MLDVEMERWRNYFGKSGVDIWTIILHAINIAAVDYPNEFRDKRGEIAEILFARELLKFHSKEGLIPQCVETRDGEARVLNISAGAPGISRGANDHGCYHDDAEALTDELEEEALVLRDIDSIKATIADADQPESVVLEVLERLRYMQITVDTLKATEIGKLVYSLKKHPSKRISSTSRDLVRYWKVLVDDWVKSAKDVTTAAATTAAIATDCVEQFECSSHEKGLASPPLDESVLLDARAPTVDLYQLFSFIDGDICIENKDNSNSVMSIEPSVKDNLTFSTRSQSGSMLTVDSIDFDNKDSSNHPWGTLRMPEERGSATRDIYCPSGKPDKKKPESRGQIFLNDQSQKGSDHDAVQASISVASRSSSGPCRPSNEVVPKRSLASSQVNTRKPDNGHSCSNLVQRSVTSSLDKASLLKVDKHKINQRLEMTKRRLQQGYQQAENAKRQRTVQVLNFPDIPKAAGQVSKGAKMAPIHSRASLQRTRGGQSKRFAC